MSMSDFLLGLSILACMCCVAAAVRAWLDLRAVRKRSLTVASVVPAAPGSDAAAGNKLIVFGADEPGLARVAALAQQAGHRVAYACTVSGSTPPRVTPADAYAAGGFFFADNPWGYCVGAQMWSCVDILVECAPAEGGVRADVERLTAAELFGRLLRSRRVVPPDCNNGPAVEVKHG